MMAGLELGGQHGTKRPPDEELEGEQRLTKRMNKLQLSMVCPCLNTCLLLIDVS